MNAGTRLWGAYLLRSDTRLNTPADGGANTSSTATLTALPVDPLNRATRTTFYLDRLPTFGTPKLQTSSQVNGRGGVMASWASAAIDNFTWYWRARTSVSIGSGTATVGPYTPTWSFAQQGGAGIARSLYLYVNKGVPSIVPGVGTYARDLYLYVNRGVRNHLDGPYARDLYLYVNRGYVVALTARALFLYRNSRDGEVFPWLNHLNPPEQYESGQVDLYGDGFGQYLDATQSATLTVSSTNGGNVAGNVRDGTAAEWQSTSDAAAWIRFTWGAAKRIVGVMVEGVTPVANEWGIPRFRFDDASSQDGSVAVAQASAFYRSTEYPVGGQRQLYWLATPKVSTYLEIAVASGGVGTNRGFSEVWVIEEAVPPQNAETSRAVLNLGLLTEQSMGIVSWQNRSPNFWPANSGVPPLPAATVTVPSAAVSGLVNVEETT
jgi:hypothetical protein